MLLLSESQCNAFVIPPMQGTANTVNLKMQSKSINSEESNVDSDVFSVTSSRRGWIGNMLKSGAAVTLASNSNPAYASVFIDPDRYGDKELKIATVNKIRQNVRNAINTEPALAALFVKIAIQDALTYDPTSQDGGPDGSIVATILDKNNKNGSLTGLSKAAEKLNEIAKSIKRTTEITMADVVTFAGAEAIESAGGPRVVVQLGKMDPKQATARKPTDISYPDLCGDSNGEQVIAAFLSAGLTEREVALLYGAIGSIESVANAVAPTSDEDDEPNEMGDVEVFIPSSFGAPKEIYGKQLGVMDNKVFASVVSDMKKGKQPIADVFKNEKVLQWAKRYSDNKNGFLKDLPEAYGKLVALGTRYTGGKVGSLLGQTDSDI